MSLVCRPAANFVPALAPQRPSVRLELLTLKHQVRHGLQKPEFLRCFWGAASLDCKSAASLVPSLGSQHLSTCLQLLTSQHSWHFRRYLRLFLTAMEALMDAPGLPLTGTGELDFQALYTQMLKLVADMSEVKDASGNLKFADLCEFLAAEFPEPTHRDQFAKELQELEQSCCAILGHEVAADNPVRDVPAPPPPASARAVGHTLCQYRLRLWDLGFVEEAAIRGKQPKSDWFLQAASSMA